MRTRLHLICFILIFFNINFFPQVLFPATQSENLRNWILALKKNSNDNNALRNIGVYCFEAGKYEIAGKCWILVYKHDPSDPQALYFIGRLLELKKRITLAIKFYSKYSQMPKASLYRESAEGRYMLLSREQARTEIRFLLDQENQISQELPSPKAIAVFPFQYHGNNPKVSPIGKGLAEMMMTDLSQVRDLRVVERIQIQALLDEAKLGQTGLVKEGSAPIYGKMLKAGKMVYGSFMLQDKNQLAMDVSYLDALQDVQSESFKISDALGNMFLLEKDITFKLVDRMGIELTPQERERIQRIPTKNMFAFINYCMGLELQDRGNFIKASEFFQKALDLDPGYTMAKQKINENRLLISAQTNILPGIQSTSAQKEYQEMPVSELSKLTMDKQMLISNRLKTINFNIGSNFKPGIESRKASQEATEAGANIGLQDLPKPPLPPNFQVP